MRAQTDICRTRFSNANLDESKFDHKESESTRIIHDQMTASSTPETRRYHYLSSRFHSDPARIRKQCDFRGFNIVFNFNSMNFIPNGKQNSKRCLRR